MTHLSNNAPLSETAKMEIETALADLTNRKNAIVESLSRLEVVDQDTTGRAADFIAICSTWIEDAKAIRVAIKRPYADAVTAVDSYAAKFCENVAEAIDQANDKVRAHRKIVRERAQAQAKAQAEAEARIMKEAGVETAVAAPVVAPVRLKPARGDFGGSIHDRDETTYEIEDLAKVPDFIMQSEKVRTAILSVAKDFHKHMKDIPGIRISKAITTVARKT